MCFEVFGHSLSSAGRKTPTTTHQVDFAHIFKITDSILSFQNMLFQFHLYFIFVGMENPINYTKTELRLDCNAADDTINAHTRAQFILA